MVGGLELKFEIVTRRPGGLSHFKLKSSFVSQYVRQKLPCFLFLFFCLGGGLEFVERRAGGSSSSSSSKAACFWGLLEFVEMRGRGGFEFELGFVENCVCCLGGGSEGFGWSGFGLVHSRRRLRN